MSAKIPTTGQLVLDFDGVLCDSAGECLWICWCALTGAPLHAFAKPRGEYAVPADVAERYWRARPYMRHLAHFVVPLLGGPPTTDRAAFAERFERIPPGLADCFADAAAAYRAAARNRYRDAWLALHGVWPQVSSLAGEAYIATARDRSSVMEILGAHGTRPDPSRIFDALRDKRPALREIAAREALAPADVWLLDDSIDNCLAARREGFGAGWASWGCSAPGDESIAVEHGIAVIALDDVAAFSRAIPTTS